MSEPAADIALWLSQAQAGRPEALGQALEAYRHYLLGIAQRELDSALQAKGGASDLVQDTFLEAQRDFAQFHGVSAAELQAWLRQLLLNNLADFRRHYRGTDKRDVGREVPLQAGSATPGDPGLPAEARSPSGEAVANEQAEAVQAALARLPEEYRQVLVWRYQEGRSFEEIGQRLQRTANAARKLFARALERFEQELESKP
jgi:RNA polymerase sigma-70 factor (ECF subfamily)